MNKAKIVWLIVAASLVFLGIVMFCGVMTVLKWDFMKLSTDKFETNSYQINEEYQNISVVSKTADIEILPSESFATTVVCYSEKNLYYSVSVKDGTLVIELVDARKWYEYIGVSFKNSKVTVYLPRVEYENLSIKNSTGNVDISEKFKFENINVDVSTGDISNKASVTNGLKIKTSTGDITVKNASVGYMDMSLTTGHVNLSGIVCEGNVNVKVSTGKSYLTDVVCKSVTSSGSTGDIFLKNVIVSEKISIERDTGDVSFDRCDATEMIVKTTTGDVEGSLLSEKIFITKTSTGKIEVPQGTSGGTCNIATDTGNIKIRVV